MVPSVREHTSIVYRRAMSNLLSANLEILALHVLFIFLKSEVGQLTENWRHILAVLCHEDP